VFAAWFFFGCANARNRETSSVAAIPADPRIYAASEVEKPAEMARPIVVPKYPATLEETGFGDTVNVEYVVDAGGRFEPNSLKTISYSRIQFVDAVREALPRMRFTAAEVRHRRVRQLVKQSFQFASVRVGPSPDEPFRKKKL
jgi:hypothetical protein